MWFLQNLANASFRFSLPAGKDLIIGRRDCDLLIEGDQSISRKHAILRVDGYEKGSKVTLTDCKSKFGSLVNGRKLSSNQTIDLFVDSELKFGQGPTTGSFKLVYESLVFCCSSMTASEKQTIKKLAKTLRGRVVSSWSSECTHLVMTKLNVTIKVVSALSSCRPIITPAWLEDASQCFSEGNPLPNTDGYLPRLVDDNLDGSVVSFQPNFERKLLFRDRTLYFLSTKQFSTLHQCVESAGARCVDISQSDSIDLAILPAKESVVLDLEDDVIGQLPLENRKWVEQVKHFLESHDLRTIKDSEIGFALLYNSIDDHFNPRSKQGIAEEAVALPPPSLSQMPATQYTQDQYQPHQSQPSPHTHPSTPSQSSTNPSILAPDSQISSVSQNTTQSAPKHSPTAFGAEENSSSASSDAVVKINETVFHGAKARRGKVSEKADLDSKNGDGARTGQRGLQEKTPVKRKRGTSTNELEQPDLDRLFGDDDDISPIEVKSKVHTGSSRIGDFHGPLTSTQAVGSKGGGGRLKNVGGNTEFSIVNDSAPSDEADDRESVLNTSKLPGLKNSHNEMIIIGAKGQSNTAESQVPHSLDGSILAPSSLTMSSHRREISKADGGDGNIDSPLPNSGLISEIFQNKSKRKRGADVLDDDVVCLEDQGDEVKKKRRREEEERPVVKKTKVDPREGSQSVREAPENHSAKEQGRGGLFGALQSKRKAKADSGVTKLSRNGAGVDHCDGVTGMETSTAQIPKSDSKPELQSQRREAFELEASSVATPQKEDKLSYRDRFSRPLDSVEKTPQVFSSEGDEAVVRKNSLSKTPVKMAAPPEGLLSPFLSTRKQKKKKTPEKQSSPHEGGEGKGVANQSTALSSSRNLFSSTQGTATQNSPSSGPPECTPAPKRQAFASPFTFLATEASRIAPPGTAIPLGRRSKAITNGGVLTTGGRDKIVTAADALWAEEREEERERGGGASGFDGENPFGTQLNDDSSQIGVYKPVLAEDGFIRARSQPKLQMSRLGRFALRTKRQLLTSPGAEGVEDSEKGGGVGGVAYSQLEMPVEIVRLRLVTRKPGEGRKEREEEVKVINGGLKNYKKFRKTRNTTSSDSIPRFINLQFYAPNDDSTLQDWAVSETTRETVSATSEAYNSEDDDDVFNFVNSMSPLTRRQRR